MTISTIALTVPTYADTHQPSEDTVLIIELSKLAWAKLLRILMRKYSFVKDKRSHPSMKAPSSIPSSPPQWAAVQDEGHRLPMSASTKPAASTHVHPPSCDVMPPHTFTHPHVT